MNSLLYLRKILLRVIAFPFMLLAFFIILGSVFVVGEERANKIDRFFGDLFEAIE